MLSRLILATFIGKVVGIIILLLAIIVVGVLCYIIDRLGLRKILFGEHAKLKLIVLLSLTFLIMMLFVFKPMINFIMSIG